MKTTLREKNGITVIDLEGVLDYESTATFKEVIKSYLDAGNSARSIVINMEGLNFIGSMGVNEFVSMMKEFNSDYPTVKFCGAQQDRSHDQIHQWHLRPSATTNTGSTS